MPTHEELKTTGYGGEWLIRKQLTEALSEG